MTLRRGLLLLCLLLISITGCGQATYEERLKASAEFYEYMQQIEANLASPIWERNDQGIKMRLPLPFRAPMQGPERLTDDDGNIYFGPDPRQLEALGLELPGIIEAWQAELPGESGEGIDSRIYVLSNHSRFKLVDGAVVDEPMEFLTDVENILSQLFDVSIPEGISDRPADHLRYAYTTPTPGSAAAKYTSPKKFTVIRFVTDVPINGQAVQASLYEHQSGDIQAAVLVVGPRSFSSQFRQRLELALQTLAVSPLKSSEINRSTGKTEQGGVQGF